MLAEKEQTAVVSAASSAVDAMTNYNNGGHNNKKRVTFAAESSKSYGRNAQTIEGERRATDGFLEVSAAKSTGTTAGTTDSITPTTTTSINSPLYSPMSMSYGGMDTMSTAYGMGGLYSPYYSHGAGGYGMMGMMSPGFGDPGITNLLFGFQGIVFSLGQTIQVRTEDDWL